MKKIILSFVAIFITIASFTMLQSATSDHSQQKNRKKTRVTKVIDFIPDEAFGGNNAQGRYTSREQKAIITNGNNSYSFMHITAQPTNPWLPDKKNLTTDIVAIGSFSKDTNRAGMPVTTYLFGMLENNAPVDQKKSESTSQLQPNSNILGSNSATWAPITFQPSEQFNGDGLIGNYFSSHKIATIHDPSQKNTQSYTFEQVQEGGSSAPEGLTLIGSFTSQPAHNGNIYSHAIAIINLYGKQKIKA